jgi:hypothetical protein
MGKGVKGNYDLWMEVRGKRRVKVERRKCSTEGKEENKRLRTAIDNKPGSVCFLVKFSSAKVLVL